MPKMPCPCNNCKGKIMLHPRTVRRHTKIAGAKRSRADLAQQELAQQEFVQQPNRNKMRDRPKVSCGCDECNGKKVDARTEQKHNHRPQNEQNERKQRRPKKPCDCFQCRGQMKDPRTVEDHLRKPRAQVGVLAEPDPIQMPEVNNEQVASDGKDEVAQPNDGTPVYNNHHPLEKMTDSVKPHLNREAEHELESEEKGEDLYVGEVVLAVLDWWTKHRGTASAASDVWHYTKSLCDGPGLPSFKAVKKILDKHQLQTMLSIDVCVDMCVAFYDPESRELMAFAFDTMDDGVTKRLVCPRCNEKRFLDNSTTPRRVVYYFPYKFWLQDLLTKVDLAPLTGNDHDPKLYPSGHIRHSDGWRIKVKENPNMNSDSRNVALSGSCDGVPYFKDRNAMSGWPFVLTDENLPPGLCKTTAHAHMVSLAPAFYKTNGEDSKIDYIKKDPKSLQPVMLILTDELLRGQSSGFSVTDYSVPAGIEGREFNLKTVLLMWTADYPGLQKCANMFEKGFQKCHWCFHCFETHSTGHQVARDMRRHLPPRHALRTDLAYGPHAMPKPKTRTHAETVMQAQQIEAMPKGPEKIKRQKSLGIYGMCFFTFLDYFDIIWDLLPDIMHIHKGLWNAWLLPLLRGDKKHYKEPEPKETYTKKGTIYRHTEENMAKRGTVYKKHMQVHKKMNEVLCICDTFFKYVHDIPSMCCVYTKNVL